MTGFFTESARKAAGNKSEDQRDLVTIRETDRARLGPSAGLIGTNLGITGAASFVLHHQHQSSAALAAVKS